MAFHLTVNYREAYGLHASNGILFNHESPRRSETFVTRKITRAVGRIKHGLQDKLVLGTIESRRDWGFAGDYAVAIWKILQKPNADDYVIGTGISMKVGTWLAFSSDYVGIDPDGYVAFDERYLRPTEVPILKADASKASSVRSMPWKMGTRLSSTPAAAKRGRSRR